MTVDVGEPLVELRDEVLFAGSAVGGGSRCKFVQESCMPSAQAQGGAASAVRGICQQHGKGFFLVAEQNSGNQGRGELHVVKSCKRCGFMLEKGCDMRVAGDLGEPQPSARRIHDLNGYFPVRGIGTREEGILRCPRQEAGAEQRVSSHIDQVRTPKPCHANPAQDLQGCHRKPCCPLGWADQVEAADRQSGVFEWDQPPAEGGACLDDAVWARPIHWLQRNLHAQGFDIQDRFPKNRVTGCRVRLHASPVLKTWAQGCSGLFRLGHFLEAR